MAAVYSILHMLSMGLLIRNRETMQTRQERMEQIYSSFEETYCRILTIESPLTGGFIIGTKGADALDSLAKYFLKRLPNRRFKRKGGQISFKIMSSCRFFKQYRTREL
ncbi:hypothetical protein FB479_103555 [Brevibacillus sp. AG162]|nr:hypothetical protein FB479_103555 [Brevibacillus sp. AG162]